jgi:predicted TIM-barrel fold metal-dependent hydrolase
MIIDADCHISPTPEGAGSISADELLRRMDRAGVDKALAWLQPPYMRQVGPANAYVARAMKDHPDRILGFGWADPHLGVEEAREEARRCVEDYGLCGVKLNGAQNGFCVDEPALSLPVVEQVAALGSILAFHVGADAFEQTHPFRVAKVARRFPDLPVLMVHMGGVGHADLTDAAIEFAAECPNLTLIGSAVRTGAILKAIRTLGARRLCFGSDTPFELMHVERARYDAMLEGVLSEEEKALVMGGNVARVLGFGGQ